jgi:5-methylcytosine-specific restriction endonuclease McrA
MRYGRCEGYLQRDHIIDRQRLRIAQSQARLKRHFHPLLLVDLEDLIRDPANQWLLCERHHHLKSMALIEIPRRILPADVESFARCFRIEYLLDRHFGPREAVTA